jgi:hypothetical protein
MARRARLGLLALILLYLFLGAGYALLMPPWEAPDEAAHYQYARTIARTGRLPKLEENYEATQPPLYYWLAAGPLWLLDRLNPAWVDADPPPANFDNITRPVPVFDWTHEWYNVQHVVAPLALRLLGVAGGALALWLIYRAAERMVPGQKALALATAAVTGLNPQFLHIAASVNSDVLALIVGAAGFWLLAVLATESRPGWQLLRWAALAVLAVALVKLTLLPVAAAVLLAVVWRLAPLYRGRQRQIGLLLLAFSLLLALALLALPELAARIGHELRWRLLYVRPDAFEPLPMVMWFTRSYWGLVGWAAVGLADEVIGLLSSLALLGALASLRFLTRGEAMAWQGRRPVVIDRWRLARWLLWLAGALAVGAFFVSQLVVTDRLHGWWIIASLVWVIWWLLPHAPFPGDRRGWRLVWLVIGLALLVVGRNALATPQFQGRFLFPVSGPLSMVAVVGWRALLPGRAGRWAPAIAVFLLLLANVLLIADIIGVYFQPMLG